ncbi:MAG: hypothetical protein NTV46_00475 [Verrucomicrobia bacterium]|nr:hypothetical protein [Verrucomicrobiota bacterium]
MSKTTRSIAALLVLLLLLTMGVVIFRTKPLGNSEAVSARLGLENASMTERWIICATQSKLDAAFPGMKRGISAYGGEYVSNPENQFEVLTAKNIYWWEGVDSVTLNRVATEVESLPDLETWVHSGTEVNQQRKVELRVVGTPDRPILRILFLCSNLPDSQTRNDGFLKNMWP